MDVSGCQWNIFCGPWNTLGWQMSLFVSALIFQSPNLGLGTSKGRQCRSVNGQKKVFMKCRAGPVLSITIHRHSTGAADTGHSHYCWLLSLIWPLTVTTAVPPPDVWRVSCLLLPHITPTHDSRPLMTPGRGPVGKQSYHRKINLAKQLRGTHNSFRAKRTHLVVSLIILQLYRYLYCIY